MADFIEKTLIAVASEDGKNVNRHFGKAEKFYIYESAEDEINLLEIRNVSPGCSGCGNHNDSKIEANLEVIKDCDYLIVERIGEKSFQAAESFGIEPFEIPGNIEEGIDKLIRYIKVQKLFD